MEINEKNKKKEQQALIIRKYQQYLKLEKSLSHHVRHNQRNDQFEDTFHRNANQTDPGIFFVLLHIRKQFLQHDCFPPWSDEFLRVQKMRLQYLHMQIL